VLGAAATLGAAHPAFAAHENFWYEWPLVLGIVAALAAALVFILALKRPRQAWIPAVAATPVVAILAALIGDDPMSLDIGGRLLVYFCVAAVAIVPMAALLGYWLGRPKR
jgi:hypothetical protein